MPSLDAKRRLRRIAARSVLKRLNAWAMAFGVNAIRFAYAFRGLVPTLRDYRSFRRLNRERGTGMSLKFSAPCLDDRYDSSGSTSGHYFHQDLLVARKIFRRHPKKHVDVASRFDGFVAHVASFREIEVLDIRPMGVSIPNVRFTQMDLTNPASRFVSYCDSLSCLHALEHFGLGRYGDPVDPEGHEKGFANLHLILQTGGVLYLSVPIGRERVEFNAERILAIRTVMELARGKFELLHFSFIDDSGTLHEDVPFDSSLEATNAGCRYGCGVFEFRKL